MRNHKMRKHRPGLECPECKQMIAYETSRSDTINNLICRRAKEDLSAVSVGEASFRVIIWRTIINRFTVMNARTFVSTCVVIVARGLVTFGNMKIFVK